MGGVAKNITNPGRDIANFLSIGAAIPTLGASLHAGPDTRQIGNYTPGGQALSSASAPLNSLTGVTAARQAQSALLSSQQAQNTQSSLAQQQLLETPKNISPDNFLALKNQQLANLKLGLASTITGGGGTPSAVLSRPSLQAGGQGKTKYGQ